MEATSGTSEAGGGTPESMEATSGTSESQRGRQPQRICGRMRLSSSYPREQGKSQQLLDTSKKRSKSVGDGKKR